MACASPLLASHPHPFSVWEAATILWWRSQHYHISNQASSHPAPGPCSWSQASPDLCQKRWCKAHLRCRVALAPSQEKCEETTTEADWPIHTIPIRNHQSWRPTSKKCWSMKPSINTITSYHPGNPRCSVKFTLPFVSMSCRILFSSVFVMVVMAGT